MKRNVEWLEEHSAASLRRLLPRIEARFKARPGFRVTDMYSVLFAVATST